MTDLGRGLLGLLALIVAILWVIASGKNDNGKKLLILLGLLIFVSEAYALEIDVSKKVYEGTAFAVRLKGEVIGARSWEAKFLGKRYKFFGHGYDAVAYIAVPLNAKPRSEELQIKGSAIAQKVKVRVSSKQFPASVVTFPALSSEKLEQNRKDKDAMKNATDVYSEDRSPQRFYQPLSPRCYVTSPFGKKRLNAKGKVIGRHWGADCEAMLGEDVYSVSDGIVKFARETLLGGKTVIIDHGHGIFSIYMHLSEFADKIMEGSRIPPFDMIGKAGATGRASGPHLHWGMKVNGIDVDPIGFLKMVGAK